MYFLSFSKKQTSLKKEIDKIKSKQEQRKNSAKKRESINWILSFLLLINGASLGYLLQNKYLVIALGGIFVFFPVLYQSLRKNGDKFRNGWYTAFKIITREYQSCYAIEKAVQNTLMLVPEGTKNILQKFLQQFKISKSDAIVYLKNQMPDENLKHWCDIVSINVEENIFIPLLSELLKQKIHLDISSSYHEKRKSLAWVAIAITVFFILVIGSFCIFAESYRQLLLTKKGKLLTALVIGGVYFCICQIAEKGVIE